MTRSSTVPDKTSWVGEPFRPTSATTGWHWKATQTDLAVDQSDPADVERSEPGHSDGAYGQYGRDAVGSEQNTGHGSQVGGPEANRRAFEE
ncbi:MAG: hypothetical protein ABEJ55_04160 [Halanaeroarchaeum sp.]